LFFYNSLITPYIYFLSLHDALPIFDEIYLDLTELPGRAEDIARTLKNAVTQATGLTCSIAIAPNKLLAKIWSDLDKPDGLTILRSEEHTSELQSRFDIVCRLLLEKK